MPPENDAHPRLSLVVAVYNTGRHLKRTLESISVQDCRDMEVICVDDCSSDGSDDIINDFVDKDDRFILLRHDSNQGTHVSRMDGMSEARGTYIWVIDGDDTLPQGACNEILDLLRKHPVDILHLGTAVINENSLDTDRVSNMKRFTKPVRGSLRGEEVFKACFIDRRYRFNIWNKVFSNELIKRSLGQMERTLLPKGQDMYEFFVLSHNAESYYGAPDLIGYEYHFGIGITGHDTLDRNQFTRYCTMSDVAATVERYSADKDDLTRKASASCRGHLLDDNVANWYRERMEDRPSGFDTMIASWGPADVISRIARHDWFSQDETARSVIGSELVSNKKGQINTVATYYHSIANGGVQKVIPLLLSIWMKLGYHVILITDEPPSERDYGIPEEVERFTVQKHSSTNRDNYVTRAEQLSGILKDSDVDLMVYHAWVANTLLWDMLVCKTQGVRFVTCCHNVFPMMMGKGFSYFATMPGTYRLMDGVVTLNRTDTEFWRGFNSNVFEVHNPVTIPPSGVDAAPLDGHDVLWAGRMASEKRPDEAVRIFAEVHRSIPDSRLIIVGDGSRHIIDKVKKLVSDLNLSDSVIVKGFEADLSESFHKASVFLSTSEHEGYMLTLAESMASGVPAVMYDLPYLTLVREGRGLVTVPQNDTHAAASEVCKLLRDHVYRRRLGAEGREYAHELEMYDLPSKWKEIFDALSGTHDNTAGTTESNLMWDTMMQFYRRGVNRKNDDVGDLKRTVSYRVGRTITYIPRRLLGRK